MWDLIPPTIEQALTQAWDSMDPQIYQPAVMDMANTSSGSTLDRSNPTLDSALLTSGLILNFGTPQTQQPTMSGTGPTYPIQDSNPLTTHPEPGLIAPGYLHKVLHTRAGPGRAPGWGQPQESIFYNRRIHTSHRGGTWEKHIALWWPRGTVLLGYTE